MKEKSIGEIEGIFLNAWNICNERLKKELIKYYESQPAEKGEIKQRFSKALEEFAARYFHHRANGYNRTNGYYSVGNLIGKAGMLSDRGRYGESMFYCRQALLKIAGVPSRELKRKTLSISSDYEREIIEIYNHASWLYSMPKKAPFWDRIEERCAEDNILLEEMTQKYEKLAGHAKRLRMELGPFMRYEDRKKAAKKEENLNSLEKNNGKKHKKA